MIRVKKKKDGFTLIEIMVTIIIIGILTSIAVPQLLKAMNVQKINSLWIEVQTYERLIEMYVRKYGYFSLNGPVDADDFFGGGEMVSSGSDWDNARAYSQRMKYPKGEGPTFWYQFEGIGNVYVIVIFTDLALSERLVEVVAIASSCTPGFPSFCDYDSMSFEWEIKDDHPLADLMFDKLIREGVDSGDITRS